MALVKLLEALGRLPAEIWLLPPIVILATVTAIGLMLRSSRLRRFRAIADRTGLEVKAKIFDASEVRGTFRGRALVMTTASSRRPTWRKTWTLVTVDVKNPEFITLHLDHQDVMDTLLASVGMSDIRIGDEAFDKQFVIRSNEPDLVKQLFQSAELREGLLRAGVDRVDLIGSKLHAYYTREERDPEHAELFFTAVTRLAEGIDALEHDDVPEIIRVDRR